MISLMAQSLLQQITPGMLLQLGLIAVTTLVLIRFVRKGLPWLAEHMPRRLRLSLLPLVPVLQLIVLVVAISYAIPLVVDPTTENVLALLGASAIAIGFAFQDYISSLIAGIVTVYERPYRLGDWIEIDGVYGEVVEIGFRALKLLTPDDTEVTIPHKRLWSSSIFNNNSGQQAHLCVAEFHLDPDHDPLKVQRLLHDVALTSPYLKIDRAVVVVAFEKPWGTLYRLKAYPVDGRDQFRFVTDLTTRGKLALRVLGVGWSRAPVTAR